MMSSLTMIGLGLSQKKLRKTSPNMDLVDFVCLQRAVKEFIEDLLSHQLCSMKIMLRLSCFKSQTMYFSVILY